MNPRVIALLAIAICPATGAMAEVPEAVLLQLKTDMKAAAGQAPGEDNARLAKEIDAFEKEAKTPGSRIAVSFDFSPAELDAFMAGKSPPTDEEMQKAIGEIKTLIGEQPMPKLLAYYETLRASGGLAARQKFLHLRLCRKVLAFLKTQ